MAMVDLAPSSPQKNRMTYWSRHDPVVMPRMNTDHWTVMRRRAEKLSTGDPRMAQSVQGIPPGVVDLGDLMKRAKSKPTRGSFPGPNGDGRVDPKGDPVFSSVTKRDLHGAVPGNYTFVRPTTTPMKRQSSIYYQRARDGFKYWYQERPKPTGFGRYGLGTYKTVLGIGNAPRT